MVQARLMTADRLENSVRAHDIGVQEGLGISKGVVDMGLGGEVDNGVGVGDKFVEQRGIGHVPLHQTDVVPHRCKRLPTARIGQRVQYRDRRTGGQRRCARSWRR